MKKISFIICILGILTILFLANNQSFKESTIKNIEKSNGLTKIKIEEENITLIVFEDISEIKNGDKIKYYGEEDLYNGEKQIIIKRLII